MLPHRNRRTFSSNERCSAAGREPQSVGGDQKTADAGIDNRVVHRHGPHAS
jgi:hypothetical protein